MENQGYEEDQSRRDRNSSPHAYRITHRELRTEFPIESIITEESNFPLDSLVHPDGHVYEDIASGTEEAPRKFIDDSSYEATINNVPSSNEVHTVEDGDILANKSSIESRTSDRARIVNQLAMEKIARDLVTRKSANHVTPSNTFQRNLTLPFRRAVAPNHEISNSSVRVTSKEKSARLDDSPDNSNDRANLSNLLADESARERERNGETAESEQRESRDVRPSRRRKKKDCKHCRSKVNGDFSRETLVLQDAKNGEDFVERADRKQTVGETFDYAAANGEMILTVRDVRSFPVYRAPSTNQADPRSSVTACKNTSAVFSISDGVRCLPPSAMKFIEYEKVDVETGKQLAPVAESNEDKALITPQKARYGMRVNSIYSQEQWYAKEGPIFYTDIKEQSAFQRAYSLPIHAQSTTSPASQNRVNLRRSARGEPPPQPAKLRKHRHGWTLHLARPLEGSPGCTRSLVLLLVLVLALLGIGAIALYIVFEPEKLQIIQQYLRSSTGNSSISEVSNTTGNSVHQNGSFIRVDSNQTTTTSSLPSTTSSSASSTATRMALVMGVLLNGIPSPPVEQSSTLPEVVETTTTSVGLEMGEVTLNSTRYCDDCLKDEVCVALVDEDVPICRTGVDPQDPTGCSGLCVINKQRCHRLDVDAFRCVEVEHYCLDDEWTCSNTLCIPLAKHCDGHMNCYDHSDEYNCVCDLETHFQCGNGTSCLPLERRCDGKIDCWDATDEINCTLGRNLGWSCPLESEFTCSNGECILKTRFCDGLADCTDGSDEPHGCKGRCNKHEFTCQNSRCIAKGMKCNGVDDCGDGTDERHCKDRLT